MGMGKNYPQPLNLLFSLEKVKNFQIWGKLENSPGRIGLIEERDNLNPILHGVGGNYPQPLNKPFPVEKVKNFQIWGMKRHEGWHRFIKSIHLNANIYQIQIFGPVEWTAWKMDDFLMISAKNWLGYHITSKLDILGFIKSKVMLSSYAPSSYALFELRPFYDIIFSKMMS